MWNQTHNIFYISNAYADILKVIERYKLTYGDWDCLQNLLEYGIAGSNESRACKYKDLVDLSGREVKAYADDSPILYKNVIPDGKYPLFEDNDYFIQHPFQNSER